MDQCMRESSSTTRSMVKVTMFGPMDASTKVSGYETEEKDKVAFHLQMASRMRDNISRIRSLGVAYLNGLTDGLGKESGKIIFSMAPACMQPHLAKNAKGCGHR